MTNRVQLATASLVIALGCPAHVALAGEPAVPRLGVLVPEALAVMLEDGLRAGLLDRGYTEGKNISIEWRRHDAGPDAARAATAELLRAKTDLLVAVGTPAARAVAQATNSVPIVFLVGDPVSSGLATSLARPGGNATGISGVTPELGVKQLDLLHTMLPKARRFGYVGNSLNPLNSRLITVLRDACSQLGAKLVAVDVRNQSEIGPAFRDLRANSVQGAVVSGDLMFVANRQVIAHEARAARLPAIYLWREFHDSGVLMSYGFSGHALMKRLASYVDRILRGALPGELPIEQVAQFELVINLREARALGVSVPQDLLLRADQVIQ